jgi:hypothetical protein
MSDTEPLIDPLINSIKCPPRCPSGYRCVNKLCNPTAKTLAAPAAPAPIAAAPAIPVVAPTAPAPAKKPVLNKTKKLPKKNKIIIQVDTPLINDQALKDCPPKCPAKYKCDKKTKKCLPNVSGKKPVAAQAQADSAAQQAQAPAAQQAQAQAQAAQQAQAQAAPAAPAAQADQQAQAAQQAQAQAPAAQQAQAQAAPADQNETEIMNDSIIFSIPNNKELLDKELKEYNEFSALNTKEDANEYSFLYPHLNDSNFNRKISNKKEFADTQYNGKITELDKEADKLCNAEFELAPHQNFVRNFLSFQTPYNSLLLYHGLGTGKTCSAISVSEEMRDYLIQMGITNKILVVASPNVQNNFKLQLFDETKLKEINGIWNINACTGNKLLKEINPFNTQGLTRENIITKIKQIINAYYTFMGYIEFANYINKYSVLEEGISKNKTEKQKNIIIRNQLQKHFNNRLIIVDEVHNIRITDDNQDKRVAVELFKLVKNVNNLRLLLLSATPMYNSYKEIIWLINLMNLNDKRPTIQVKDIFNADGTFKLNENGDEVGKKLLERKATGYISFVRGENPYTFPYRIWPSEFSKENTFQTYTYPRYQLNGTVIIQGIDLLSLFLTTIGEYQQLGYSYIIEKMKTEITDKNTISFENMEKFGYTLLQKPLEALNIVYPHKKLDSILLDGSGSLDVREIVGKTGLARVMDYETDSKTLSRYNFKYKNEKEFGRIFSQKEIGKYSNKIYNICQRIMNSEGVILVYSQYIDGGIVPIALALEELGFTRARDGRSLFETPPVEPIDAVTLIPKSKFDKTKQFFPAKYVMITGDKGLTPDSINDIKLLTADNNSDGSKIKVVLISQAASEGVDLKFIRQVHIVDPWYNMNRIEQIIGRAVRNCSHKILPFSKRNVEIYLYGTILTETNEEAIDLYVYRLAELKSIQIGYISRVLKEISVDCILNYAQTNFNAENMKQNGIKLVELQLSSNKQKIMYSVGDKPFSATCDYMKKCMYKCVPASTASDQSEELNMDTYHLQHMVMGSDKIIQRVKELFKERFFYGKNEIIKLLTSIRPYPINNINYSLNKLVKDNYEYVTDKYGRIGNIVNIGDMYLFQPIELTNKSISAYDRTVPVDYKHNEVVLSIAKEKVILKKKEISIADLLLALKNKYMISVQYTTDELKDQVINPEDEWYKHARVLIDEMIKNKVKLDIIKELIIAHIIEELAYTNMVTLLNYYSEMDDTDDFEQNIKKYIDTMIIVSKTKATTIKMVILWDNGKNKFMVYDSETKKWNLAQGEDMNDVKKELELISANYIPVKTNLNKYVGFMGNFKNLYMSFKVKDITNKRAKGSRCDQMTFIGKSKATKNDAIEILEKILIEGEDKYSTKIVENQTEICCKQELILRLYNREEKLNKKWFIPPGIAILINFENI